MRVTTGNECILNEITTIYGHSRYTGVYALAAVANHLAAAGGEEISVSARIEMPDYTFKSRLHAIQKELEAACELQNMRLEEVTTAKHTAINLPGVTISGISRAPKEETWCRDTGRAGWDVVLVGWIGMEGMLRILDEKEQELRQRFSPTFIHQIQSRRQELFAGRAISVAKAGGSSVIRQVTEGGIMAALWNLAKEAETGLDLDLKKLSILQETIEVCEHYRLNPYQLASTGCLLITTDNGEALTGELKQNNIQAAVIGKMTDDNDKKLHNGEEVRYIDRPAPDEIYKIYGGVKYGQVKGTDTEIHGEE